MTVGHLSAAIQMGENRATREAFPVRDRNEMRLDKVQRAHRSGVALPLCNVRSRKAKKDAVSWLAEVTPEHPSDVSGHKMASHTHKSKLLYCVFAFGCIVAEHLPRQCSCYSNAIHRLVGVTDSGDEETETV